MMQTNARDAEKCIKKEREILRVSEMNSRRRKRWWLSYYKRAIHRLMALSWLKKISRRTTSSSKSGTALAALRNSELGTGNSLTFDPMTSSSNKVITNGLHNNSSGKILVSITDNVVTPSSSSAATHGSSRKKSAKNKTSLGLLFPSNIKSPSYSSSFAESPPVVPIEVEIATDKIQPLQTNVPTKAAAQQEPNNIVVQDESLTLGKGEQNLDSECCLSRDMAIAEMAHIQSSASPSGTKPKSAANEERRRASVDTEVLGCLKRAQDDEVK